MSRPVRRSRPLAIALIAVILAGPTYALTPKTKAYLHSIGIDPRSAEVVIADADGKIVSTSAGDPEENSLESLATQGKRPNAVKTFIKTRAFISRLKKDFEGTLALGSGYSPLYLTPEESALADKKSMQELRKKAEGSK